MGEGLGEGGWRSKAEGREVHAGRVGRRVEKEREEGGEEGGEGREGGRREEGGEGRREEEGEGGLGRGGLVMQFPYNFLIALTKTVLKILVPRVLAGSVQQDIYFINSQENESFVPQHHCLPQDSTRTLNTISSSYEY